MIMTRYGAALIDGQKKYFPVIQREFANKTGEFLPAKTIDTLERFVKEVGHMPKGLTPSTFKIAQETVLKEEAKAKISLDAFKKNVLNSLAGLADKFKG